MLFFLLGLLAHPLLLTGLCSEITLHQDPFLATLCKTLHSSFLTLPFVFITAFITI